MATKMVMTDQSPVLRIIKEKNLCYLVAPDVLYQVAKFGTVLKTVIFTGNNWFQVLLHLCPPHGHPGC
ncbi:hypothetical protein LEMLEM_LOCUS18418 [Lemmus lemmus]